MTAQLATSRQIDYINRLREDKSFRLAFEPSQTVPDGHGGTMDMGPAYLAAQIAGLDAYNASLDGITAARASEIIDALKAW